MAIHLTEEARAELREAFKPLREVLQKFAEEVARLAVPHYMEMCADPAFLRAESRRMKLSKKMRRWVGRMIRRAESRNR